MGFRFRKRIKIAPGVHINLSKSGVSTSIGGKGMTLNVGKKGTKGTIGIPGTGISYSSQLSNSKPSKEVFSDGVPPMSFGNLIKLVLFILFVAWVFGAFK